MKKKIFSQTGFLAVGMGGTPFVTIYSRDQDSFTKLAQPATIPIASVYDSQFSADGKYLALGVYSPTKPLLVYKREGSNFTALTVPSMTAGQNYGGAMGVAMTEDASHVAIGGVSSPWMAWYRRDGDVLVKLPNPTVLPGGTTMGATWDPTGTYLVFTRQATPYLAIYKRDGDSLTKLNNPAIVPSAIADKVVFSPDGKYMAVTMRSVNKVFVYERNGDSFTKLNLVLGNGEAYSVAFSPDSTKMAVGQTYNGYLEIFNIAGGVFTKIADPFINGGQTSRPIDLSYSPDGNYLAVTSYATPYLTNYKCDGLSYTKLATPSQPVQQGLTGQLWTDYVEVSKNTLSFAKVNELPATLEANTMYMVPGSTAGDLKIYLSDMSGETVRHVVASDELTAMVATATATLNEVAVVSDIAARDALGVTSSKTVLVLDASADVTVTGGSATYQYVVSTGSYHKLSERESMDLLLTWDSLVDGVLSSAVDVDDAVALRHTHYDLSALDQITVVSNQLFFAGTALVSSIEVAEW